MVPTKGTEQSENNEENWGNKVSKKPAKSSTRRGWSTELNSPERLREVRMEWGPSALYPGVLLKVSATNALPSNCEFYISGSRPITCLLE